eukprot:TRINITY_DN110218_c0_g1_i1.p1 TRINITY_DN110218_c0_g1~~TRINITY_DN110218_c0_g1_i1.p1  ORF type:complete len:302 (+),score=53.45 TRINITY_DN110218_c0_g1_i1:36-941(+)
MFAGCAFPQRRRASSAEEAIFIFNKKDASNVQGAIAERIEPSLVQQAQSSLQVTFEEICQEHPEDASNLTRARARTNSELSEFAASMSSLPVPQDRDPVFVVVQEIEDASVPEFDAEKLRRCGGLVDHEELTRAVYESQGLDFAQVQGLASEFLKKLGLRPQDLGVKNVDEHGETLLNQCFYLSLAHAYLGNDTPQAASSLALLVRRAIESAVLASNPEWTHGLHASSTGEGPAMVFADFLPIAMRDDETCNLLAKLAVCILDSVAGHVEVFLGPKYNDLPLKVDQVRNFLLLWYVPGNYQ